MFKRCLIFVLLLAGVGCAWGQDDGKWAWSNTVNLNINYDDLTWTSWDGSISYCIYGNIYVVKPGEKADLDVRVVNDENADIGVTIINKGCPVQRQWRFVNDRSNANLSIRFVKSDEHFSVRFISYKEWYEWWNPMNLPVIDGCDE